MAGRSDTCFAPFGSSRTGGAQLPALDWTRRYKEPVAIRQAASGTRHPGTHPMETVAPPQASHTEAMGAPSSVALGLTVELPKHPLPLLLHTANQPSHMVTQWLGAWESTAVTKPFQPCEREEAWPQRGNDDTIPCYRALSKL